MERGIKVAALAAANSHILGAAVESQSELQECNFFCECGRPECKEEVSLTVEAFTALRADELPVLAPGHRLSQVARARMLREDASALRAQARQQTKRARKNLQDLRPEASEVCPECEARTLVPPSASSRMRLCLTCHFLFDPTAPPTKP